MSLLCRPAFHAQVLERDILEVKLPVRQSRHGKVIIKCEYVVPDGHWSRALSPLLAIPYQVFDHTGGVVVSGIVPDGNLAVLNSVGLVVGSAYRVRAMETSRTVSTEPTAFVLRADTSSISLAVQRQTTPVHMIIRAAAKEDGEHHWSARLPLPHLIDVLVVHKQLSTDRKPCVIYEFLIEGEQGSQCRRVLDPSQLFVGETYLVQIACSSKVQTARAAERVKGCMAVRALHFNGAGDDGLDSIEQCWCVDFVGNAAKREQNHAVLDEMADTVNSFPGIFLEVRGDAGSAKIAPAKLAEHYKLHQRDGALLLMAHLARNRANACIAALVKRGVHFARLRPTFKRSGRSRLRTEFVPQPQYSMASLVFEPTAREFTVGPTNQLVQQVEVSLRRTTTDLIVRLVAARANSHTHWSSALAVANGVPIVVRHKIRGLEVIRATVYDGEVRLPGADIFYVNEIYTVEVLETIRTLSAEKSVTIYPGHTRASEMLGGSTQRPAAVCVIPIERPARRIQCMLLSEMQTGDRERQLQVARKQLHDFMSVNKVFFNGAAEPATQASALGTAQAWSVAHLNATNRNANRVTLDGIAAIVHKNPDVSLEVRGETTKHAKAERLGEYFNMHAADDVRAIMDLLARRRGEACYEALKQRGVDAARMWVTSAPMGEAMKVDFIPHASQIPGQYQPLPAGVPFRLMHQRYADYGLDDTMRRMQLFMASRTVHFNGAGEQLTRAEQAWSIKHTDPTVARSNWETLAGVARIMLDNSQCALEVHGETGDAKAAPRQLAAYLDMNRTTRVRHLMDRLAEYRAQACLEALVELGVERERLFVTFSGLGSNMAVQFVARSMRPYAPMHGPFADPFALVHEGVTVAPGNQVLCPLPPHAALYVDEIYVLQVPPPALEGEPSLGLDNKRVVCIDQQYFRAAYAPFQLRAESDPDTICEVHLELKRVKRGTVKVTARSKIVGGWADELQLPRKIFFAVHKVVIRSADSNVNHDKNIAHGALNGSHTERTMESSAEADLSHPLLTGTLHPTRPGCLGAVFDPDLLEPGAKYAVLIPSTTATRATRAVFMETAEAQEVVLVLERNECPIHVRWEWAPNVWYSSKPLPSAVPYVLWCTTLESQVDIGVLRYAARKIGTVQDQVAAAVKIVTQLLDKDTVSFNSASDKGLSSIEQSWSIHYEGDADKLRQNHNVLEKIAQCLAIYPDIGMQLHGLTGDVDEAPEALARFYGMQQRSDVVDLCALLAKNRAAACMSDLVRRGVAARRLIATSTARSGHARVDFYPQPLEQVETKRESAFRRLEQEAELARRAIADLLQEHSVVFNSDDEAIRSSFGLKQAWNVDHAQAHRAAANREILNGVARVLRLHPELSCEVRCAAVQLEVSAAETDLAEHFRLDSVRDAQQVMEFLAQNRAQACLDALVQRGVPRQRLYCSRERVSDKATVGFVPQAVRPHDSHASEDVLDVFRRHGRNGSGGINSTELRAALKELGIDDAGSTQAETVLKKYDNDRSGTLEAEEFSRLVADLRRYRSKPAVVHPPHALLPTTLPAGAKYELRVRAAEALGENTSTHVQQFDPHNQLCTFETTNGDGTPVEVKLVLAPLSAAVTLTAEIGRSDRAASSEKPWYHGLTTIGSVPFEVRHKRADQVILTGAFSVPGSVPLHHEGTLFVGDEYEITTTEGSSFIARTDFVVCTSPGLKPQEVIMRGVLREATLTIAFESASGQVLPPGIRYRVKSRRLQAAAKPLVQMTTSRAGTPGIEEVVTPHLIGGFLLHDVYLLEVDGSSVEGGVASHSKEFVMDQLQTRLVVRLLRRGHRSAMILRWRGPPIPRQAGAVATGDGDDVAIANYAEVAAPISFKLQDASSGKVLLAATKANHVAPTVVGEHGSFDATLFQGDELTIETEASHGYAPSSTSTIIPYEARFSLDIHLSRSGALPSQQQPLDFASRPGANTGNEVIRLLPAPDQPGADALRLPTDLGFRLSQEEGVARSGYQAQMPALSGFFDTAGVARFDGAALVRGEQYRIDLAFRPTRSGQLLPIVMGDAAPADPATASFLVGSEGQLELRRRTRDVHIMIGQQSSAGLVSGELHVEARHVKAEDVVCTSGRTVVDGEVRVCRLQRSLFVGEEYFIHVRKAADLANEVATLKMRATILATPAAMDNRTVPQVIEFHSSSLLGPRWYDEQPASVDRKSLAADARRLHKALTAKVTNYGEIIEAVSGKSVADLQLLRSVWKELYPSKEDVVVFLKSRGSMFKRGATKLEELFLLSKDEFDVHMLNSALEGQNIDMMHVLEVFCTSMPHALLEMRHKCRVKSNLTRGRDLVEVMEARLGRPPHADSADNDNVCSLLVSLLDGADEAATTDYSMDLVARDMQALRAAIHSRPHGGWDGRGQVRDAALPILTRRSRKHLQEVATAYHTHCNERLGQSLADCFQGDLKLGVRA